MRPGGATQVVWLLWFVALAVCSPEQAVRAEALVVRGAVSGAWEAPVDTVVIDSFAWVPAAETLRISPGMVIAMSGRFSLVVNGTLLAEGTVEDSIYIQRTPFRDPLGHLGIRFRNTSTVSRLAHVVIEDGFANLGGDDRFGGALEVYHAEVEIDSCWIRENRARIDGGAIYGREAAVVTVRSTKFSGDSTRFGAGGAILMRTSGSLRLIGCEFADNKAVTHGGAVAMESGVSLEMRGCGFRDNIAFQRGGAVQLRGTPQSSVVEYCQFKYCAADIGGAFYLENTRLTVEDCEIRDCDARLGGGIAARGANNLANLTRLQFVGNSASEEGGGVYLGDNARGTLGNSILRGNLAMRGGGVYCAAGTSPVLRFLTMVADSAGEGRAIYLGGAGILSSSIITGEQDLVYFGQTATTIIKHSDIYATNGDAMMGFPPQWLLEPSRVNVALQPCDSLRNVSLDPLFVNESLFDLRLSVGSPCLFGADTANAVGLDFAGNVRVQPVGTWPDMGAVESSEELPGGAPCGAQSGVWFPGDYVIGCSLRVEQDDTLILMGGAKLWFAPNANLHVVGTLLSLGAETDSVMFDRYFELLGATWSGIDVAPEAEVRMDFSVVRHVVGRPAIRVEADSGLFRHCSFSLNENSDGAGGAIAASAATHVILEDCDVAENAAGRGAGLYALGTCEIARSRFERNAVRNLENPLEARGGAVYAGDSSRIFSTEFDGNFATLGGALYLVRGGSLETCAFDSNLAHQGGAVYVEDGNLAMRELDCAGNSARDTGGAGYFAGAFVRDTASVYHGNQAATGGALWLGNTDYAGDSIALEGNAAGLRGGAVALMLTTTASFRSTEFWNNRAGLGGAAVMLQSSLSLEECLLDSNRARDGGGVFAEGSTMTMSRSSCVKHQGLQGSVLHARSGSAVAMNSVLLANNGSTPLFTEQDGQVTYCLSDVPVRAGDELIGLPERVNVNGDSCDGEFNLIADARLVNPGARDYRLSENSPAIHAADPAFPLDEDGTRADIGRYAATQPYAMPTPFNLREPSNYAYFLAGDTVHFSWNESRDSDPGDTVHYHLHVAGGDLDTTVETGSARTAALSIGLGHYVWFVEAVSQRPDTPRRSFEMREFHVAGAVLEAGENKLPLTFDARVHGANPFNNATRLQVSLPHSGQVRYVLYDVLGRAVESRTFELAAGVHEIEVEMQSRASGVYWAEIAAGVESRRMKLVLLK